MIRTDFTEVYGFHLQMIPVLDWRGPSLRLLNGAARRYADFSARSLAGRLGQGVAILFMEHAGFSYVRRYDRPSREKGPDFIFEDSSRLRALVEAKGSFVTPGGQVDIKGDLDKALVQLLSARNVGQTKNYAITTCFREVDDTNDEPTLIAFVDPDSDPVADVNDPDSVRRENYAAWLSAMRFFDAGSDLRSRQSYTSPREIELPVLTFQGYKYAVVPIASPHYRPDEPLLFSSLHPIIARKSQIQVIGLEIETMRVIEEVFSAHNSEALSKLEKVDIQPIDSGSEVGEGFHGSVLSDGSLYGEIDFESLAKSESVIMNLP